MTGKNKFIIIALVAVMALAAFSPVLAQPFPSSARQMVGQFKTARDQFKKEVDFYRSSRQQFLSARNKLRQAKNNPEIRAQYEERARDLLRKSINIMIGRLEAIKAWVANRKELDDQTKSQVLAEIDKDIAWLKDKESQVDNATIDEIRSSAKEARQYWQRQRWQVKKIVAQLWTARLNYALDRFEQALDKAEEKINELKQAGYDTAELEEMLADARNKLDEARSKYEQAKEKWQEIDNLQEANQFFKEVRDYIKEANQYLRDAYRKLREIIEALKQAAQS